MSYVSIRSFVLESRVRETTQTIGRVDTPKRERKWRELERELERMGRWIVREAPESSAIICVFVSLIQLASKACACSCSLFLFVFPIGVLDSRARAE
jgi:hypothetical protein